ncbi:MAG: hypothetical protein AVDCRST_MAG89-4023 [uncultured Gemmatimonadetes bacterium]|uniref:Uncharacterized protein n=1 Tax=uncultured Gemmatimonadota bacterium TaxID=203437 RepID=A0A6J4MRG4_9BACT|nr:MAG: hypothetical protein AVDCRST_MAG89-4023 [uncultured Gemmatimonadota bacterium]
MNPVERADVRFALCVRNEGYPASLEIRKLYPVLPDLDAAEHGLIRVVDESGEDYLYPADNFLMIPLSRDVEEALLKAS